MTGATYHFWQLLGEWKLSIPIIQRDYAQGRKDKRTTQLRDEFLDALLGALHPAGAPLNLDLVYGAAERGQLILLDGQQRITTLWLLHWYLAKRVPGVWAAARERLGRFTYETRISSREFCAALTKEPLEVAPALPLPAQVTDARWYFRSWTKDPTIRAMMVTLDAIHQRLCDTECDALWECAIRTSSPPITFQLLPLPELRLTDDLYIKMNARGRTLTDFENFKAWLELKVDQEKLNLDPGWMDRLDGAWTDLFWNLRDKSKSPDIDDQRLQFFKSAALNSALGRGADPADALSLEDFRQDRYVSHAVLGAHDLFGQEGLKEIFALLDRLSSGDLAEAETFLDSIPFLGEGTLFRRFVSRSVTYAQRTLFYALSQWLLRRKPETSFAALEAWMRVMRNLVGHSEEGGAIFRRQLPTIHQLALHGADDARVLLAEGTAEGDGFSSYQWAEEKLKARLAADPEWAAALRRVEDHPFFKGQIGFLLEFAKTAESRHDRAEFEWFAERAMLVFAENGLMQAPDFLLQRALLQYGDYLMPYGGRSYSFCGEPSDWTQQLREPALAGPLRKVLGQMAPELAQAREDLLAIIARPPGDDWRKWFIVCPEAIGICGYRVIHFEDEGRYLLLLTKGNRRGWHYELRSFCFFERYLAAGTGAVAPLHAGVPEGEGGRSLPRGVEVCGGRGGNSPPEMAAGPKPTLPASPHPARGHDVAGRAATGVRARRERRTLSSLAGK